MSLPACEQRVLKQVEVVLRASDPRLAAMYTMFARLNAGEPVGAEALSRVRLPRPRLGACAMILIPLMFAAIAISALLSGSARGATTCGVAQPAVRGGPSRVWCPPASQGAVLERIQDHAPLGESCRLSSSVTRPQSC
jgi:Protein of unknown function (DUF3040)